MRNNNKYKKGQRLQTKIKEMRDRQTERILAFSSPARLGSRVMTAKRKKRTECETKKKKKRKK